MDGYSPSVEQRVAIYSNSSPLARPPSTPLGDPVKYLEVGRELEKHLYGSCQNLSMNSTNSMLEKRVLVPILTTLSNHDSRYMDVVLDSGTYTRG